MKTTHFYLLVLQISILALLGTGCNRGKDDNLVLVDKTKNGIIPFSTNPRFYIIYNATGSDGIPGTEIVKFATTTTMGAPFPAYETLTQGCSYVASDVKEIKFEDNGNPPNSTIIKLLETNERILKELSIIPITGYRSEGNGENLVGVIIMNKQ